MFYLKKAVVMVLVAVIVLTGGCGNKRELNELAIVLGTAVDLTQDDQIEVTVQIVKPGEISSGAQGGGGGGEPVVIISSRGRTVFDAIRNFTTVSSKKLFFSHNQVVIFGEDLMKGGVQQVIDIFERDHEFRTEVPLFAARGRAAEILEVPGSEEKISAIEIKKELDTVRHPGWADKVTFHEFVRKYDGRIVVPVVPQIRRVEVNGRTHTKISGMAVIKGGRLAGWLDETETRGLLWVQGRIRGGIIPVKAGGSGAEASMEVKKAKAKIIPETGAGLPVFRVQTEVESNLGEAEPFQLTEQTIEAMKREQADIIKKEVATALKKAREELKADIFGFGETLHRAEPRQWEELKTDWDEYFQDVEVRISVKSELRNFGDKNRPTIPR